MYFSLSLSLSAVFSTSLFRRLRKYVGWDISNKVLVLLCDSEVVFKKIIILGDVIKVFNFSAFCFL